MAGLGIDAGAHETGGASDDGIGRFWVDEVIELSLAFVVVAGDAHDVFGVGGGEVGVGVDHRLPHPFGVIDVLAKDDGLGEAVGRTEEFGDLGGNKGGALFENEIPVEVAVVVFAVFDDLTVLIGLPVEGTPAVEIAVKANANNFVGCKKSVRDALPERVGVDGIAEVFDVRDVLRFFRGGGEADLRRAGEIFEHLAPGGIIRGATPVALVDDNEVKEVWRELGVNVLVLFSAGDGLIEAEVDLERLVDGAIRDFGHRRAERLEVVGLRLVGEDVAIHEKENAFLGA